MPKTSIKKIGSFLKRIDPKWYYVGLLFGTSMIIFVTNTDNTSDEDLNIDCGADPA